MSFTKSDKFFGEGQFSGKVKSGDQEDGGEDQLFFKDFLDSVEVFTGGEVGGDNGDQQTGEDGESGNHNRIIDGLGVELERFRGRGNDEGGTSSFSERSEQVRSHTGDIPDIISDVISNGSGVIW
jgi:hypothetical protein